MTASGISSGRPIARAPRANMSVDARRVLWRFRRRAQLTRDIRGGGSSAEIELDITPIERMTDIGVCISVFTDPLLN